jgi:DNA-binding MurR/RpiR family transcriptional regulator
MDGKRSAPRVGNHVASEQPPDADNGRHPFVVGIQRRYAALSPVHRRIADFVLSHEDEVVFFTTTALARELGVSEASIVRLARALGFKGFRQFQAGLRDYSRHRLPPVSRVKLAAGKRRSLSALVDEVLRNDLNNLQATHRALDHKLLIDAAESLWKARTIFVIGARTGHSLAVFLYFSLRMLGRNSRLLTPGAGDIPEQLVEIGPSDVAIGISFDRYARATVDLFDMCVRSGATGIAITDKATSPLAHGAAFTLMSHTRYLTFIDSFVGPISVINALLSVVAVRHRRSSVKSLARLERTWTEMKTYR